MMNIFDFNIHLTFEENPDVNKVIEQDMKLNFNDLQIGFNFHDSILKKCKGGNILLFNTKLFEQNNLGNLKSLKNSLSIVTFTALIDFRRKDIINYIDILFESGIRAVMVNSYLQKISEKDFKLVLFALKYASQKGLIICIDGSYGTSKMYTYDNLKLACFISDYISKSPIVIVHGGGYRVIEAMLLAAEKENIWLDTSFSIPYYENSSVEKDFAYSIQKLNFDRVLFGSDLPYMNFNKALETHLNFFKRYNFSSTQIDKILIDNAFKLFDV